MPPAMRSRAATISASVSIAARRARGKRPSSEGQRGARHGPGHDLAEFVLDAAEGSGIVGFEAQHDNGRGVGGTGKSKTVRVFDAQAIDADDLGGAWERLGLADARDERMRLAFATRNVELGRGYGI